MSEKGVVKCDALLGSGEHLNAVLLELVSGVTLTTNEGHFYVFSCLYDMGGYKKVRAFAGNPSPSYFFAAKTPKMGFQSISDPDPLAHLKARF